MPPLWLIAICLLAVVYGAPVLIVILGLWMMKRFFIELFTNVKRWLRRISSMFQFRRLRT